MENYSRMHSCVPLRASLAFTLVLLGCGTGQPAPGDDQDELPPGCSDEDGDGYGVGRDCAGPDCDEWNPNVHECAFDCDVDPESTGCPCEETLEPIICYDGPDGAQTRRPCRSGIRTCIEGHWSGCAGQVLPMEELCNDEDDDCDGEIDDGVRNECGNCDPECTELEWGGEDDPWNVEEEGTEGLVVDRGALTLDEETSYEAHVWIPNGGDATVSKIDSRTTTEVARYRVAPAGGGGGIGGSWVGGISVNTVGSVVVGIGGGTSRVTRVDGRDCPPGHTSEGGNDVLDFEDDACVIWSTEVSAGGWHSGHGEIAWEERAVLDGIQRFVWVGDIGGLRVFQLDEDGDLTDRIVSTAPGYPGSIEMEANGNLWVPTTSALLEIDTEDAEVVERHPAPGGKPHCVTIDPEGKVWVSDPMIGLWVFDRDEGAFEVLSHRGEGIAVDPERYLWLGGTDSRARRIDRDTYEHETFDVGLGAGGGWGSAFPAVDPDGMVWMVTMSGRTASVFPQDDPGSFEVPVDTLSSPGACGDATGAHLGRIVGTGVYRHTFEGCDEEGSSTTWVSLRYEADVPPASRVHFAVRTAADVGTLAAAPFVPIGSAPVDPSPLDIAASLLRAGVVASKLLEVRITLEPGPDGGSPLLWEIGIRRSCSSNGPG